MGASSDQVMERMWLQQVKAFCQKRGWTSLEAGDPPQLLVQWPVNGKPMLVQVAPHDGWGLMLLVPLGSVPQEIRQATLLAAGTLNYRLSLACLELEPIQGEARARVTLTPAGELPEPLLERAFRALEEAIAGLAMGVEMFCTLQKAAEAVEGLPAMRGAEAMLSLWESRPATD